MDETEAMARKLCRADGRDPDHRAPEGGYWSLAMGGRAGEGHQAPKQWVDAEGPPQWTRYLPQAARLAPPQMTEGYGK